MIDPIKNNVYITPIQDANKYGSLFIPDEGKERCDQGIVKYVGPECEYLKIGDYVLFPNYAGTLMHIEDEGHIIIMEEPIVTAIINKVSNVKVPGLFFQVKTNSTFPQYEGVHEYVEATYEEIFNHIARIIQEEDWYRNMRMSKKMKRLNMTPIDAQRK